MFKITAEEKQFLLRRRKTLGASNSLWQIILDKSSVPVTSFDKETQVLLQKISYALKKVSKVKPNEFEAASFVAGVLLSERINTADARNIIFKAALRLNIDVPTKSF